MKVYLELYDDFKAKSAHDTVTQDSSQNLIFKNAIFCKLFSQFSPLICSLKKTGRRYEQFIFSHHENIIAPCGGRYCFILMYNFVHLQLIAEKKCKAIANYYM